MSSVYSAEESLRPKYCEESILNTLLLATDLFFLLCISELCKLCILVFLNYYCNPQGLFAITFQYSNPLMPYLFDKQRV